MSGGQISLRYLVKRCSCRGRKELAEKWGGCKSRMLLAYTPDGDMCVGELDNSQQLTGLSVINFMPMKLPLALLWKLVFKNYPVAYAI